MIYVDWLPLAVAAGIIATITLAVLLAQEWRERRREALPRKEQSPWGDVANIPNGFLHGRKDAR